MENDSLEFNRFNPWKVLAYANEIKRILDGEFSNPVIWHVYISNYCPYSCNFCDKMEEMKKYKAMLPLETLDKLVEDADRLGIKVVHFCGAGEPLTHPNLNKIIKKLKKRSIKVDLTTNGYLLHQLSEPVDYLRISFNAGTRENYMRIHRKDGFERVKKNVREAVEQRKGTDVGLAYLVTHQNWQEIEPFVRIAEELGVDFIHIRPAFWSKHDKDIRESYHSMKIPKSQKVQVFAVSGKFDGYWNNNKYPCRGTPLQAVLTATGDFALCLDRLDLRWGNYNSETFEEIWKNPEHRKLIKQAQDCNIRCVQCNINEIIEKVFINNQLRLDLI